MEEDNYVKQLNDSMTGKLPSHRVVIVGNTSKILLKYGANPLKITLEQSNIKKIAYPEGYMSEKHNLGFYALGQLPKQLENPVAILKSATQPNSFVVFTELIDNNGYPVMVPIHLDKNGKIGISNKIASMYGKVNLQLS